MNEAHACNGRPEAATLLHLRALEGFLIEKSSGGLYQSGYTGSPLPSTRGSLSPGLVP